MKLSRVPGLDGLQTAAVGQLRAARARLDDAPVVDAPDAVLPREIPSVARNGSDDRVLARIDQDGFAFAEHADDRGYFERRGEENPRLRYAVHIVLRRGRVCVRKEFRRRPLDEGVQEWVWSRVGVNFAREAAALLRLRDLPFVPTLREVDLARRTLYMDYIAGESLAHHVAARGHRIHVLDLLEDPSLRSLSDDERDRREARLARTELGRAVRDRIASMVRAMNERGVAPLDIKLGNVLIGATTGQLYWLDFERAHVTFWPRFERAQWHHRLAQQRKALREWFDIEL